MNIEVGRYGLIPDILGSSIVPNPCITFALLIIRSEFQYCNLNISSVALNTNVDLGPGWSPGAVVWPLPNHGM